MNTPIVAIAASAGGLEAISELLGALPARTGMAYIAVPHLSPNHRSLLAEILSKKTLLSVMQVQADVAVEPDRVYLIAPNTTITLDDGMIRVVARETGVHHPADILFSSVARQQADLAMAVVLSGGDSDGALGVRAVKEAGGITFAQDPASATAPSMPQAAIATGCVDFIRRPADIARELVRLAAYPSLATRQPDTGQEKSVDAKPSVNEATLQQIFKLMRIAHGVDFTHYKRSTLGRRLDRRMAFHRIEDVQDYIQLLENDASEVAALYQDFLIRVTGFFRDPASFEALAQQVFPSLTANRPANAALRIWIPGCATGEEVYSIAIALLEHLGDSQVPIQIFGTDISDVALEKARAGVFLHNIAEEISAPRLARFFSQAEGHYHINKRIRDLCVFARHDITRDPPFSRLDLVSCRNLLIYLDATAQRRVMDNFRYALKPRGFLLLGISETVGSAASLFDVVDSHHRLYAPSTSASAVEINRIRVAPTVRRIETEGNLPDSTVLESDLARREADRILLNRFAPASVLVDDALNILQFRGETAPYVEHASGPSSLNLHRVVRSELLVAIAPAIQTARETGVVVHCPPVRLDERPDVSVEVIPLRQASPERCYLILLEGSARGAAARRALVAAPLPESEKDRRLEQLEQENSSLRDYLQVTIEQHEANQEELKSAHEEVMSANEEFQSTNEELETAKEELQSANEELTTTNEELRQRNRDLGALNISLQQARAGAEQSQAAADIIVESVREPLLVLDEELRIVRANRAYCLEFATRLEELENKFLYHVNAGRWNIAGLRQGLLDVLARGETLEEFEVEMSMPGLTSRSLSLTARKMRGDQARPALILLAIADVTARNANAAQAAQEMKRKDEFLATLAHELRNPLAPIATAVQLLRGEPEDESAAGLHDMIDRQTRRLTRLVDELLDVGRFNRGLIELRRAPLDMSVVLQNAAASMRQSIARRRHELVVTLPDDAVFVFGDAVRLEQVVANLLENASKYSDPGGRIELTLACNRAEAVISVKDNGVGLEPASLDTIFTLFTQIKAPEQGGEGLGIGLTLVRRVVELHGGRVQASSDGLGKGSEFRVYLPTVAPVVASSGAEPAEVAATDRSGTGLRMLVVDDNEDARVSLALLLRAWGHDVSDAADAASAIATAAEFQPQVALIDIGMPGMNGYQLARYFRAMPRYSTLQLIAMTGFGREEDRQAASAAGFNHHLVKPVAFDDLEVLLARIV